MDPLPFLILAIMLFGTVQLICWFMWRNTRDKPIHGTGSVKPTAYKILKEPRKKK